MTNPAEKMAQALTIIDRLRSTSDTLRRKPTPLSDYIKLLHEAAASLEAIAALESEKAQPAETGAVEISKSFHWGHLNAVAEGLEMANASCEDGELPPLPIPYRTVQDADGIGVQVFRTFQLRDYARAALAASAQQVEQVEATLMHQFNGEGWRKECVDTDALLEYLGLDPKNCRTDGGWLNLPRIKTLMQEFHGQGEDATGTPVGLPFRFTRLAQKPTSQQVDGWTPVTEKMLPACVNALVFGLPAGVKSGYPKRVFMIYTGTRPRESVEDYEITHWHIPAAPTQPAAQQGGKGGGCDDHR